MELQGHKETLQGWSTSPSIWTVYELHPDFSGVKRKIARKGRHIDLLTTDPNGVMCPAFLWLTLLAVDVQTSPQKCRRIHHDCIRTFMERLDRSSAC